jgi:hypothetical protein
MSKNVGTIDRALRVLAGLVLVAYAAAAAFPGVAGTLPGADAIGNWAWIGWIGVVPLATGIAGSCPVYAMMGVSTCGV